jgi:hypothetical protein
MGEFTIASFRGNHALGSGFPPKNGCRKDGNRWHRRILFGTKQNAVARTKKARRGIVLGSQRQAKGGTNRTHNKMRVHQTRGKKRRPNPAEENEKEIHDGAGGASQTYRTSQKLALILAPRNDNDATIVAVSPRQVTR